VTPPQDATPEDPPLPEAVRELIMRRVGSVAELEALLLLFNSPQTRWDVAAVARRLYIPEADAAAALRQLRANGLAAVSDVHWRFEAETPEVGDAVLALADLYSRRLVVITALIHGNTARGIEAFARAFVLRRKD
jgi:hypothetical protein